MKTASAILCMIALALCLMAATPDAPVSAYAQPQPNDIREIIVTSIPDGDTVTADVLMGKLGGTDIIMRGVRLRLKGVSCYEMSDPDPKTREVAIVEREALAKMLFGAKHVTARLYRHGTFDRHDAEIFTETLAVNAAMLAYPQGGRGVK